VELSRPLKRFPGNFSNLVSATLRLNSLLTVLRALPMSTATYVTPDLYRKDGVRITHDPLAPGMAEKYGRPGKTDNQGFDPYQDTVGPGIYGGIVKRDADGRPVVGRQYQNHNPHPGPVYADGGYTPINAALGDNALVTKLLGRFPDLVNDISTGGAQPLHMCGMSAANQQSTAVIIARGGDIEALDTYGMTPLHRMASNNLAIGAAALLAAGADPTFRGTVGQTPLEMARASAARDVIKALEKHGTERRKVPILSIIVAGAGLPTVDGEYVATEATEVPSGFAAVCRAQGWSTSQMWEQLNKGATWYKAPNGAYIYWNHGDRHWWIDEPGGDGVFKAPAPAHAPPQIGWLKLGEYEPLPSLVATFRPPIATPGLTSVTVEA